MQLGMKFRTKPVVVEALRVPLHGPFDVRASATCAEEWARLWVWLGPGKSWEVADDLGIDVEVDEDVLHAAPGDWIVRREGFVSVYPHEAFESKYEGYDA